MQTLEYRTVDKSDWGQGDWQNEPDKKQWQDEKTGYPCLIVRNRAGALCGYVGVAKNHPLYELGYGDRVPEKLRPYVESTIKSEGAEVGKRGVFELFFYACEDKNLLPRVALLLDVHGSITFADKCMPSDDPSKGICHLVENGEDDDIWWLGFDCNHCDDFAPAAAIRDREFDLQHGFVTREDHLTYRNLAYVTGQIEYLAHQLKVIELNG